MVWSCPKCSKLFCANCCSAARVVSHTIGGSVSTQQIDIGADICPVCDASAPCTSGKGEMVSGVTAPIKIRCPKCAAVYKLDKETVGHRATCKCGHIFVVAEDLSISQSLSYKVSDCPTFTQTGRNPKPPLVVPAPVAAPSSGAVCKPLPRWPGYVGAGVAVVCISAVIIFAILRDALSPMLKPLRDATIKHVATANVAGAEWMLACTLALACEIDYIREHSKSTFRQEWDDVMNCNRNKRRYPQQPNVLISELSVVDYNETLKKTLGNGQFVRFLELRKKQNYVGLLEKIAKTQQEFADSPSFSQVGLAKLKINEGANIEINKRCLSYYEPSATASFLQAPMERQDVNVVGRDGKFFVTGGEIFAGNGSILFAKGITINLSTDGNSDAQFLIDEQKVNAGVNVYARDHSLPYRKHRIMSLDEWRAGIKKRIQ